MRLDSSMPNSKMLLWILSTNLKRYLKSEKSGRRSQSTWIDNRDPDNKKKHMAFHSLENKKERPNL
jgi:hypothetical protein